jgi:2-oxo-3-hexenedioate decarboxylase
MTALYQTAFAEQVAAFHARVKAGMPRAGWKVGLNVPEVQRKLGLSHALVGWLDGDQVLATGARVSATTGAKLHVEPELCIRMANAVDATCVDPAAAFAAVGGIAPALELVDYAKPVAGLDDVVRCSMFHHATIVGAWQAPRRTIDIAAAVTLQVDEQRSEPARSDLVPSDLGELVLQVNKLLAQVGEQLLPSDLILSGSFTAKAVPVRAGQSARAVLGDFGAVTCVAQVA